MAMAFIKKTSASEVLSGFIATILMSSFAVSFAAAIFDEADLDKFVEIGVGMNYIAIIVASIFGFFFSFTPIMLSAPDVNPSIIFGDMAQICRAYMLSIRTNVTAPLDSNALSATVLTVIMISTCLFGITLYLIGRFKLTRILQLLPTSVLCGFMASVGYTIAYKATELSVPLVVWNKGLSHPDYLKLLLPAIGMGLALFIQTKLNKKNQALGMPLVLFLPLVLFFIIVYSTGETIESERRNRWFIETKAVPENVQVHFKTAIYGSANLVNAQAIVRCVPQMFLLCFICTIDVLLKIAGIRKNLQDFDMKINEEVMISGKASILSGLLVGSVAYAQPPLTTVITAVGHPKTTSRVPVMVALILNSIMFFVGFPISNFLPRFWLSGVMFFTSFDLLFTNLFESRLKMSRKELVAVYCIVIVNALFSLAVSVLVGVLLSGVIFSLSYGREGSIKSIHSGSSYRSGAVRSFEENVKLDKLGKKVLILKLHRFIFFGTAAAISDLFSQFIKEQLEFEKENPSSFGIRYFILDWEHVEDVDFSSLQVFTEIIMNIYRSENLMRINEGGERMIVLFTSLTPRLRSKIKSCGDGEIIRLLHRGESWYSIGGSSSSSSSTAVGPVAPTPSENNYSNSLEQDNNNNNNHHPLGVVSELEIDSMIQKVALEARSSSEDDSLGMPRERKRCFETLDSCLEWVENRLLLRSALDVRQRWLEGFESFQKHYLKQKAIAQNAASEHFLGFRLGQVIFPYVQRRVCGNEEVLLRMEEVADKIFMVQNGRVNVYSDENNGSNNTHALFSVGNDLGARKLVRTLRKGAYFNEEAIYMDVISPSKFTYCAVGTNTVVYEMNKEQLVRFEEEKPGPAVEFHKKVSKYTSSIKNDVARRPTDYLQLVNVLSKQHNLGNNNNGNRRMSRSDSMGAMLNASCVTRCARSLRRIIQGRDSHDDARTIFHYKTEDDSVGHQIARIMFNTNEEALLSKAGETGLILRQQALADKYLPLDDSRIDYDWTKVSHGASMARAEDLCRTFKVALTSAQEMIWEADGDGKGGITLLEMLDVISTSFPSVEFLEVLNSEENGDHNSEDEIELIA